MDHPIVSVGEEVRQVDEDWYCVHTVSYTHLDVYKRQVQNYVKAAEFYKLQDKIKTRECS